MHTNSLKKLFRIGGLFIIIPSSECGQYWKNQWQALRVLILASVLAIHSIIHLFITLQKKTLLLLQILSEAAFLITNILCVTWIKRDPWFAFFHKYLQVDTSLNEIIIVGRKREYVKLIIIWLVIHIHLIVFSLQYYYSNSNNVHLVYEFSMLVQIYYRLFTCLIIITTNICIKFQYYRINSYLKGLDWHNSNTFPHLSLVEALYKLMKESVDNLTDAFGWQLVMLHGQAIINMLRFSEMYAANHPIRGSIQVQESLFTVSQGNLILTSRIRYVERTT